ncbi:MAG: hypothetical protein WC969_14845 [Elusimicrobiota bacterium]|jgi:hypothetical protein
MKKLVVVVAAALAFACGGQPKATEPTPDQLVEQAMGAPNARILEGVLAKIPPETPGRDKAYARIKELRATEEAAAKAAAEAEAAALPGKLAVGRVRAAEHLDRTFDASLLKNLAIRFRARGPGCDVLHVESDVSNLYPEMMDALGNGTVLYGKVLPGGVDRFAADKGFRVVLYTNRFNSVWRTTDEKEATPKALRKLQVCDEASAARVTTTLSPAARPTPTRVPFRNLSWATATPGTDIFNSSYRLEATIVSADKAAGTIVVKYVRTGEVEPKLLAHVASSWYVRK